MLDPACLLLSCWLTTAQSKGNPIQQDVAVLLESSPSRRTQQVYGIR